MRKGTEMADLKNLQDDLAREAFNMTPNVAKEKGICLKCKQPALPKCYSEAGRREFAISGICEPCFDELFADEDDDTDV
jgi:hypothetical protein